MTHLNQPITASLSNEDKNEDFNWFRVLPFRPQIKMKKESENAPSEYVNSNNTTFKLPYLDVYRITIWSAVRPIAVDAPCV